MIKFIKKYQKSANDSDGIFQIKNETINPTDQSNMSIFFLNFDM